MHIWSVYKAKTLILNFEMNTASMIPSCSYAKKKFANVDINAYYIWYIFIRILCKKYTCMFQNKSI